jgi:hypothetical protein
MFLHRVTLGCVVVALTSGLQLVLDDSAPYYLENGKSTEGKCAASGYGGGFHHNNGTIDNNKHFAVWNFTVSKNGCYWVEAFHPDTTDCDFRLHSEVPVTIQFCLGLYTSGLVDQSRHGGQWNKLVKLPFYTNHSAAIFISSMGFCDRVQSVVKGIWAADAFRLTWHAEDCHDEQVQPDNAVAPSTDAEAQNPVAEDKVQPVRPVQPVQDAEAPIAVASAAAEEAEPQLPLLQALMDDSVDAKIAGATREPLSQCPSTTDRTFHHDGLQKERRAEATYHFDPPRDGCYLIEEKHPQLSQCKASSTTKVHVKYGTGIEEMGTVDQTANAGQWTFIAARPFYAGRPGKVTLSNEATEPGTLTVSDQVRFTWVAKSCKKADAHPHQIEIRMTVDFENVAERRFEFGATLKTKLAEWADVPKESLRLTSLRPGSIIAGFLVLPSVVDGSFTPEFSPSQAIKRLGDAVVKNEKDLCALTGGPLEGCGVELKDHGVAVATVSPVPVQEATKQQQDTDVQSEEEEDHSLVIGVSVVVGLISLAVMGTCYVMTMRSKRAATTSSKEATGTVESEVTASMEEGKVVEGKKMDDEKDESDNSSTNCPSSDAQSESSAPCKDVEGNDVIPDETNGKPTNTPPPTADEQAALD